VKVILDNRELLQLLATGAVEMSWERLLAENPDSDSPEVLSPKLRIVCEAEDADPESRLLLALQTVKTFVEAATPVEAPPVEPYQRHYS
jgi:hypothetical protein